MKCVQKRTMLILLIVTVVCLAVCVTHDACLAGDIRLGLGWLLSALAAWFGAKIVEQERSPRFVSETTLGNTKNERVWDRVAFVAIGVTGGCVHPLFIGVLVLIIVVASIATGFSRSSRVFLPLAVVITFLSLPLFLLTTSSTLENQHSADQRNEPTVRVQLSGGGTAHTLAPPAISLPAPSAFVVIPKPLP